MESFKQFRPYRKLPDEMRREIPSRLFHGTTTLGFKDIKRAGQLLNTKDNLRHKNSVEGVVFLVSRMDMALNYSELQLLKNKKNNKALILEINVNSLDPQKLYQDPWHQPNGDRGTGYKDEVGRPELAQYEYEYHGPILLQNVSIVDPDKYQFNSPKKYRW